MPRSLKDWQEARSSLTFETNGRSRDSVDLTAPVYWAGRNGANGTPSEQAQRPESAKIGTWKGKNGTPRTFVQLDFEPVRSQGVSPSQLEVITPEDLDAQLLERYMTMYLTQFGPPTRPIESDEQKQVEIERHMQIRKQLGYTEWERIDNMKVADIWRRIATKPHILRLLGDESPGTNTFTNLSEQVLINYAERASTSIYEAALAGAVAVSAQTGGGKSRLIGRSICHNNAMQKVGSVTLDCVGGSIDNALQKIAAIPDAAVRRDVESRIRYVNTAGMRISDETYVTGWPMLAQRYQLESLHTRTQRIVQLIQATDKDLSGASIQGMNRLAPLLTSVATILAALDLPLSLAFELLADSKTWEPMLYELREYQPETREAVADLLAFYQLDPRRQEERSEVLRNKLAFLRHNPVKRAMYSTPKQYINWPEVAEQGLQVYIDLRDEPSPQSLETSLMWIWQSLMEYVRSRGSSGRSLPKFMVVVDELSYLVNSEQLNTDLITEEFREFVQVRRRNAGVSLVVATQERAELPEKLQDVFLQIPSQLMGATTNPQTAQENAERFIRKNPKRMLGRARLSIMQRVKRFLTPRFARPMEVVEREVEELIPLEEITHETPPAYMDYQTQDIENSKYWLELPKGEWQFAKSSGEGDQRQALEHLTTSHLDHGQYVQQDAVTQFREKLLLRDGSAVSDILADIDMLLKEAAAPTSHRAEPVAQGEPNAQHEQRPSPNGWEEEPPGEDGMGRHRREADL